MRAAKPCVHLLYMANLHFILPAWRWRTCLLLKDGARLHFILATWRTVQQQTVDNE